MLEGIPIAALTPWGVILVIVLMFARGLIVPRSALVDEREDTDKWREAHRISEEARAQYAEQTKELLAHAETSLVLLRSITDRAERQT